MANAITVTPDALAQSAHKFRRELLMMPTRRLGLATQYMTGRPGVTYKETVGELTGSIEIGPYSSTRVDSDNLSIAGRTLETFLGSCVKNFDPNTVVQTIYGALVNKGEGLKNVDIAQQVLVFLVKKLGDALYNNLWNAKRVDSGTTTAELFNGFDTIAASEITSGTISTANGNLVEFTEAITKDNAYDILNDFYEAADEHLQEVDSCLYVPTKVFQYYLRDYKAQSSGIPYNTSYEQIFLEASLGKCRLVPMSNKASSPYLTLSTKENMLYGYGNGADLETILVEKYAPFVLSFVATLFFGTQYESINKERLCIGKLYASA